MSLLVAATSLLLVHTLASAQPVALYTWDNVRMQGMGYVTGIVIHPTTHEVYIRTDVGGVYRYDRGQERWIPLMDAFDLTEVESLDIESVAIDPGTNGRANRVYAALKWTSGANGNDTVRSGEVVVSDDRGSTWRPTGLRSQGVFMAGNGDYRTESGERLAVDPATGNVVLFGSRKDGLWRGVRDGSGNYAWSRVLSGLPNPASLYNTDKDDRAGFAFVRWDPSSNGRVYVGVNGSGVYVSTNSGQNFSLMGGSPQYPLRSAIAADGTLYVTSGTLGTNTVSRQGSVWRFRSNAWTNISPGDQGSMYSAITVESAVSNNVMVGRNDVVWRSNNGGGSWASQTLNLRAPNASAPGYYTNDEAGVSGGVADMLIDPQNASRVWWLNGWGVTRTDNIGSFPSSTWTWRMNNLEELVVRQVEVPTKPKANGGADLLSALADVFGFRHASAETVPSNKINPVGIPLPSPQTTNQAEADAFWGNYGWMYQVWPNGQFPTPFPYVSGMTSIDSSYHAPDHVATVGFHQWAALWPLHGYSTDGGQNFTAFGSVPAQPISYTSNGVTYNENWLASGGHIAIGAGIPSGANRPPLVWVPAAATFGNPWYNTTFSYMDYRIPWPHYSLNGGQTWQVCRLANSAQRPSIWLGANIGYGGIWDTHLDDLPKAWGHLITPWAPSRIAVAAPSDTTGRTFYYFCNNGPQAGGNNDWGVFYKSTDGGQTWFKGQEGIFPSYCLRANVLVNPTNANDVWIVFPRNSGQALTAGNRIYRSTNGGTNFAPVTTANSVQYAAFGKGQNGTPALYIFGRVGGATKEAFYRSDDLGANWTRISEFGYVTVYDIDADPRTFGILYAATGGRGIFRGRSTGGTPPPTPTPTATPTPTPTPTPPPSTGQPLFVGKRISLRATNGRYVQPMNGTGDLVANAVNAYTGNGSWELFDVLAANDGPYVRLRAVSTGSNYVLSNPNGPLPLNATSTYPGEWEKFEFIPQDDGKYCLRAKSNGLIVQLVNGGTNPATDRLIPNTTNTFSWERFTVTEYVNGAPLEYWLLRCEWQPTGQPLYIYDAGANAGYGTSKHLPTYQWECIWLGGNTWRFKNRATGDVLHLENRTGTIQATAGQDGWFSSRWEAEDGGGGTSRLRNLWQADQRMHIENLTGFVQHGVIQSWWGSAKWHFDLAN